MRRPVWCKAFLIALEEKDGEIKIAAELAGCHRTQVYRRMRVDPSFNHEVEQVFTRLEDKLCRRVALNARTA